MRAFPSIAAAAIAFGAVALHPVPAAAGCLSGAALGGIAGHVAGHHGFLGAAAGCALGHRKSVNDARMARERAVAVRTHSVGASGMAPAPTYVGNPYRSH